MLYFFFTLRYSIVRKVIMNLDAIFTGINTVYILLALVAIGFLLAYIASNQDKHSSKK